VTTKEVKLGSLLNAFDDHFRHNRKRPNQLRVQAWFVLQVAGFKRSEWRTAQKLIDRRIEERWPKEKQ
jgi:hypothetical protein